MTLGIIPGAGGTQRMPRLIGIEKAIDMVLSGKPVDAAKAQELGFIDEILDGRSARGAVEFARELLEKRRGPRRTQRDARSIPAPARDEMLTRLTAQARKQYPNREAGAHGDRGDPAPPRDMPLDAGLEFEEQLANKSKATPEAKGSIHLFFAERETRKIPGLPPRHAAAPIAQRRRRRLRHDGRRHRHRVSPTPAFPSRCSTSSQEALDRGLAHVDADLRAMVKRGRITAAEKAQRLRAASHRPIDYASLAQTPTSSSRPCSRTWT